MQAILTPEFFEQSAIKVAKNLLGKFLVRRWRGKEIALMITDVEAYHGFEDKASHAARGLTLRNKIMFGKAGYWYVYFIYGTHWMLNIVTGKKGTPSAVLIRGVKGFNGPAKLTKALHIDKSFNEKLANKKTSLWIEDRELKEINLHGRICIAEVRRLADEGAPFACIKKGPRIGVDYAGPVWSKKHWRFYLEDCQ